MRWVKMEPAAVGSAAAALYAAVVMVYEVVATHHGLVRPDVILAAGSALYGLWTRSRVTPVARLRVAAGSPLPPAQASPASASSGLGDEPTS